VQVYDEYRYLVEEHGVDHVSDFSDSWISTPFLRQLGAQYERRDPISATLRVYGDVRLITKENATLMRHLGVETVLLGIESGNERVRRMNGKPTSNRQILSAVNALAANNIKVADAYVIGLIGETRESVRSTVELAREIRRVCETEISYWNIMTPLPGSHVWRLLEAMGHFGNRNGYHWMTDELERVGVNHLCHLGSGGYEYLLSVREQMLQESRTSSAEFVSGPRTASLPFVPENRDTRSGLGSSDMPAESSATTECGV
jgi:hypothetical protein